MQFAITQLNVPSKTKNRIKRHTTSAFEPSNQDAPISIIYSFRPYFDEFLMHIPVIEFLDNNLHDEENMNQVNLILNPQRLPIYSFPYRAVFFRAAYLSF
jgi:hypothetical protein